MFAAVAERLRHHVASVDTWVQIPPAAQRHGHVAELVDASALNPDGFGLVGSIPTVTTVE